MRKNYILPTVFAGIFIVPVVIWAFCFSMIKPGYVGVVVDLFGDKKGVEDKELHVGGHFIPPWKDLYRFPIFEQNHTWEGSDCFHFQTGEGLAVNAEVGITFHLEPSKIPYIFQKYRRGMNEIIHIFLRNYIRDSLNKAASRCKIEDLYGKGKEAFFDEVEHQVKLELNDTGINISRIYLIGRFNFPPSVIAALNLKIEAIQRAQQRENELREAEAEAKKQIAHAKGEAECRLLDARAQSDSNRIITESLTNDLIMWRAVNKWDGILPKFVGNGTPLINFNPID